MSLVSLIPADTPAQLRTLFESIIARLGGTAATQVQQSPTFVPNPEATANAVFPHAPIGLVVASTSASITLSWSIPTYAGHSYTEIYRSKTNSPIDALANGLHAYTRANAFSDTVAPGSSWYYFIRFVNLKLEAGPFASIFGQTIATIVSLSDVSPGTMDVSTADAVFANGADQVVISGDKLTSPLVETLAATINALVTKPAATVAPVANGDLVIEATSNTTLTIKYKGTDGTVRSTTLTLV